MDIDVDNNVDNVCTNRSFLVFSGYSLQIAIW